MGRFRSNYELVEFAGAATPYVKRAGAAIGRGAVGIARWTGRKIDQQIRGKEMTPEQEKEYFADKERLQDIRRRTAQPTANAYKALQQLAAAHQKGDKEAAQAHAVNFGKIEDETDTLKAERDRIRKKWIGFRRPRSEWTPLGSITGGWAQYDWKGTRTKITESPEEANAALRARREKLRNMKKVHGKTTLAALNAKLTPEQKKHAAAVKRLRTKHAKELARMREELERHKKYAGEAHSKYEREKKLSDHASRDSDSSGDMALGAAMGMGISSLFNR